MKKRINILLVTLIAVQLLSSCDKKNSSEPNPKKNRTEDNATTNNRTEDNTTTNNVKPYIFLRDNVSSVDIGESKQIISDFRQFDLKINNKRLENLSSAKELFQDKLIPNISGSRNNEDSTKYVTLLSSLMSQLEELSNSNVSNRRASEGNAGFIDVDNTTQYLLDAKGQQIGQILQKALMGSMQMDKMYKYLHKAISADKTSDEVVEGQNYTEREHYWDIAYGYLGRNDIDKSRYSPLFLANYIEKESVGMQGLENLSVTVYNAFYDGREAAARADVQTMVKNTQIILDNIDKMMRLRAIYYLEESNKYILKSGGSVGSNYFTSMAEALGFILALPFVYDRAGQELLTVDQAISIYNKLISSDTGVWDTNRLSGTGDSSIKYALDILKRL